ncbi:MAG: GAF domain-containing protein [Usitatibacter sp.]
MEQVQEHTSALDALNSVLITEEISRRPGRAPDYAGENRALLAIGSELTTGGDPLGRLCSAALELCRGQTAGISLIELDGVESVFRWVALAGQWASYKGGTLPRNASPCGIVIDRNAAQLMSRPHIFFSAIRDATPPVGEVLLVPFSVLGEPVGTVWVIAHDDTRHFDSEDLRLMRSLANLAAAAYLVQTAVERGIQARDELNRTNARLNRSNERLWNKLLESNLVDGPDGVIGR